MATTHYNFPTITGTDTIDGVNAINGLANAVDTALYGVANDIPQEYVLPIAGTTSLGGVRGAGQISVNPTTGDMSIGNNVITSSMIQNGAILGTNIANGAISSTQLNSSLTASINAGNAASVAFNSAPTTCGSSSNSNWTVRAYTWGNIVIVQAKNINPSSITNVNQGYQIGTIEQGYRPAAQVNTPANVNSASAVIDMYVTAGGAIGFWLHAGAMNNGLIMAQVCYFIGV